MDRKRVIIIGAAGRDFHNFNVMFRANPDYEVVAFTAERSFQAADKYCGLPVVPLDELPAAYPPAEYRTFVAVSMTQLNRVRRRGLGVSLTTIAGTIGKSSRAGVMAAFIATFMQPSWRRRGGIVARFRARL